METKKMKTIKEKIRLPPSRIYCTRGLRVEKHCSTWHRFYTLPIVLKNTQASNLFGHSSDQELVTLVCWCWLSCVCFVRKIVFHSGFL